MEGLLRFWQHLPGKIDPYIIEIGSFRVGWYGMMYVFAFLTVYILSLRRSRTEGFPYGREMLQDFLVWVAIGLVAGARLGYVLFYNIGYYLSHPLEIILPFSFENGVEFTGIAGMSYHGGLMGSVLAGWLFLRKRQLDFWRFSDFIVPVIPLAYTFGRLGNFINGELYGRPTSLPIGMHFPLDPTGRLRHPSQLYEAFFEGIVLFAVLWGVRNKIKIKGSALSVYLVGYGAARFFIEFLRQPDPQLGLVLGPLSMGQVLSLAMVAAGGGLLAFNARNA